MGALGAEPLGGMIGSQGFGNLPWCNEVLCLCIGRLAAGVTLFSVISSCSDSQMWSKDLLSQEANPQPLLCLSSPRNCHQLMPS